MIRRSQTGVDEANLQTDVMRFMAIVAFCLLAVLAMVRNIEEEDIEADDPGAVDLEHDKRMEVARSEMIVKSEALPDHAQSNANPVEPTPELSQVAASQTHEVNVAQLPAKSSAPETLSLRFASEADFLRLIAKEKVVLYLFTESEYLKLNSAYQFISAGAPGEVFELDTSTIPSHLRRMAPESMANGRWAVRLPGRVQRQIRILADMHKHGQLLINRYQEVVHVAAG